MFLETSETSPIWILGLSLYPSPRAFMAHAGSLAPAMAIGPCRGAVGPVALGQVAQLETEMGRWGNRWFNQLVEPEDGDISGIQPIWTNIGGAIMLWEWGLKKPVLPTSWQEVGYMPLSFFRTESAKDKRYTTLWSCKSGTLLRFWSASISIMLIHTTSVPVSPMSGPKTALFTPQLRQSIVESHSQWNPNTNTVNMSENRVQYPCNPLANHHSPDYHR